MQVTFSEPVPVAAIAKALGGKVGGDGDLAISGMAPPEEARPGDLTFILSAGGIARAQLSKASAAVVPPGVEIPSKTMIWVENPRHALALALRAHATPERPPAGIHPSAVVDEGAELGQEISVGALAVISGKVKIGAGTALGAGSVIEEDVVIGPDCTIHSNVTILGGTRVGSRVEIHSGTVIGSDGFGYVQKGAGRGKGKGYERYFQLKEAHLKIPQIGHVVIQDDVEIGANVAVDRGTFGPTCIGRGVKIDNLVQIAHNVVIGDHALVISQVGLSGSVQVGRHATLGGQAGIAEGSQVGDGAIVAAQCGIPPGKKIPPGTAFVGTPGRPAAQFVRVTAASAVLPRAVERLRALEREVRELRKSIHSKKPD